MMGMGAIEGWDVGIGGGRGRRWVVALIVLAAVGLGLGWLGRGGGSETAVGAVGAAEVMGPEGVQEEAGGRVLAVPVLNFGSRQRGSVADVCRTWISVQNVGEAPSQAVMLTWAAVGEGEGEPAVGPLKAECSGLIRPGSSWDLLGAQIPTGSFSAMVYSFGVARLGELGVDLGFDDSVGGYFCERLFYGVVGRPEAYERFHAAYVGGGSFAGVPMDVARGSRLTAQVQRHCPGNQTPGVEMASNYRAAEIEDGAAQTGSFVYHAAPVFADPMTGSAGSLLPWSMAYVQNGGTVTATVRVAFRPLDDCGEGEVECEDLVVVPGASRVLDARACLGPGHVGALRFESDRPLAIVVDSVASDGMSSYLAQEHSDLDESGSERFVTSSSLAFEPEHGWEELVVVSNPGPRAARVRVGGPEGVGEETRDLCAGGSTLFWRPPSGELADPSASYRWVESRSVAPGEDAPPVMATLLMHEFSGPRVEDLLSASAEVMEPLPQGQGVPLAQDAMPDAGGWGAVALPLYTKDLDGTGQISEVSVVNHRQQAGWTDVALLRYDVNALASVQCRRLRAGEQQYIDLATRAEPYGMRGALVVSAAWWSHVEEGRAYPPLLGASLVWRTGTDRNGNVPGDELGISRGLSMEGLPASLRHPMAGRCVPEPSVAAPSPTEEPGDNPRSDALAALGHLPALRFLGRNDDCQPSVRLHNPGDVAARALLVIHGEPGFMEPQSAGPLVHLCTESIPAGQSIVLGPGEVPNGSNSARVYSLGPATLAEAGVDPGSDAPLSEAICQAIYDEVIGDSVADRRFRLAWLEGGDFEGLPLAPAVGPPLEIEVERDCPGDLMPAARATIRYAGMGGSAYDLRDPGAAEQHFRYHVLPAPTEFNGYESILHIQNAGLEGTGVQVFFSSFGDCLGRRGARIFTLAAGESYALNLRDFNGPSLIGSAIVTASQPLAIHAERYGRDQLRNLVVRPGDRVFDLNGDGRVNADDPARVRAAIGLEPDDPAWDPLLDLDIDDQIDSRDVELARSGLCLPIPEPMIPERPDSPSPRRQIHLPALAADGPDAPGCDPRIGIQSLGDIPSKAILVLWGPASADPERCDGPIAVECSGLLAPGGSWTWDQTSLPTATSGTLFSVNGELEYEDAVANPGAWRGLFADFLCDTLALGVVGDCADYRRFKEAWDGGLGFADADFGDPQLMGAPLALRVDRDCRTAEGARELAAYPGIADSQLGSWTEAGGYRYFSPIILGGQAGRNSAVWLQNAGSETAEVEAVMALIWECSTRRACQPARIPPGESLRLDERCFGSGEQGALRLRSSQPLAVVTEMQGRGIRNAHVARPAEILRDLAGADLPTTPGTHLFAPLAPLPPSGWDLAINVQSTDLDRGAWVDVEFLDDSGQVIESLGSYICPGNTETYFLPLSHSTMASRQITPGSVRVTSRPPELAPWQPPGPIAAAAWFIRYDSPFRNHAIDSIGYSLLPESHLGTWPLGSSSAGPETGTAVLTLPGVVHASSAGPDSALGQIAISNPIGLPGRTEADLILISDTGNPILRHPLTLGPGQTTLVDLSTLGLQTDFHGSALVSATYWDHALPGPVGAGRELVGLAAVGLTRHGSPDEPPDGTDARISAVPAEPLRQLPPLGEDIAPPSGPDPVLLPFLSRGF